MHPTRNPSLKSIWLFLLVVILSAGLIGASPLPAPNGPLSPSTIYLPLVLNGAASQTTYSEGFEGGVLPAGWTITRTNAIETWFIGSTYSPYDGLFHAILHVDDDNHQAFDEVLLSPAFSGASGVVTMFSSGSIGRCRDEIPDYCDLELWLVRGNALGGGDDSLVKLVDDDWESSYFNVQTTVDLGPALIGGGSWRIAWRYTGTDGADVYLDNVQVTYAP